MTISNLNIFQSGTVASVTPMNENFETIRVAANTIEQTVTNNRTYLDNKIIEINQNITNTLKNTKTDGEIFCVNKGNFNVSNQPEILTVSGTTLSFSTPFTMTNVNGTKTTINSVSSVSLSGYADGTYNVFVDTEGAVEILANTICRQATEPTNTIDTVWLNTSKAPLEVKKYTSDGWEEFLKVPVGYFVISSGNVSTIKTNSYNQNGYHLNIESGFPMPDFSKGVTKSNNTTYTAEKTGWLYVFIQCTSGNGEGKTTINGVAFKTSGEQFYGSGYGSGAGCFIPIAKNSTYKPSGYDVIRFYPCLGT